jgi:fatty-acyl-CoA synthase
VLADGGYFEGDCTSALAVDAWFDTGDVTTLDAIGYMEIVDRAKDVMPPACAV